MVLRKLVKPLLACALAALAPACTVGVEGTGTIAVPAPTGSLTVTWLVTGSASPAACTATGGDAVEVVVYDASGNEVTSVEAPCENGAVTLNLPPGTYTADVTLIDAAGNARSVTKLLTTLRVISGTDLAVHLDFPAASLL